MAQSYSYISDPNWNYRHLDRLTQLLGAFSQKREEDKRKQEQRAYENAQLALKAVQNGADPNDPAIRGPIKELGRINPEAAAIHDATLSAATGDRSKIQQAEDAYQRLVAGAEGEQQLAQLLKMFGGGGGGVAPAAASAGAAMMGANASLPEMLGRSMQGMPVGQQLDALPQLQQRGVDMNMAAPSPFDPFGGDLPPQVAGLLAGQQGQIGGEPLEALRIGADLQRSPQQLAAEAIAGQQLDLGNRRQGTAEARERRLAAGGTGEDPKKAEAARVKEQRQSINDRAREIRREHSDTQAATPPEDRTPPPPFREARRQAGRELAGQVSPRLAAALDGIGAARAAVEEKLATAGASETVAAAGKGGTATQQRAAEARRIRELLPALEKTEQQALDDIANGKDPEVVASLLEELLRALQQ